VRFLAASLLSLLFVPILHSQTITLGNLPADSAVVEARKTLTQAQQSSKGSIVVSDGYDTSEVAKAKEILKASEPKKLVLQVTEFEVVEPSTTVKVPLLWIPQNDQIVERVTIKAGNSHSHYGKRRGEPAARVHYFEPKPFDWVILIGKTQGTDITNVVRNGEATDKPPVVIDRIDTQVGEKKPEPKPDPEPDPSPTPNPGPGFRVLIVRETKDLSGLTPQQVAIFSSTEVRNYLNQKTVLEGNQRAYRIWDKDTDISRENEHWKIAMDGVINGNKEHKISKATSLPHVLITNGTDGYQGPLPKNVEDMMSLLRKYGGN